MRNREPVIFEDVQLSGEVTVEAGIERGGLEFTINQVQFEGLKAGYLCPNCWEWQDRAFPEKCDAVKYPDGERGCGWPIRRDIAEWIRKNFIGEKWIGPTTSDDDEIERLRDHRARGKHNPNARIWLPGDPLG